MSTVLSYHQTTIHRRTHSERRHPTFRSLVYSIYKNRRRGERRSNYGDDNTYVDIHGPYVSVAVAAVMVLCVMDAFFTLMLIERGSSELNPFMAWILEYDTFWFYTSKYLITSVSILWVVMHKHFDFFGFKGRHILVAAVAVYAALITYEVSMLMEII